MTINFMSVLLVVVFMITNTLSYLNHLCVSMEDSVCKSQSDTASIQPDIGETILLYIFGFNATKTLLQTAQYNIDISSNFMDTSYIPIADNVDSYIAIIKLPDDINENDTATITSNYIRVHDVINSNIYFDLYINFTDANEQCSYNFYTPNENECVLSDCPENAICKGNNIYINKNWYSNYHLLTTNINSSNSNSELIIALCPPALCCQDDLCNIIQVNANQTCAANRNESFPFCGNCNNEYSEAFGLLTNECLKCSSSGAAYLSLIYIISFVVIAYQMKLHTSQSRRQYHSVMYIGTSLLFFYQILMFITFNNPPQVIKPIISFAVNLFPFDGICMFNALGSRQKLAINLIVPSLMLVSLLITMFILFIYVKTKPQYATVDRLQIYKKAFRFTIIRIIMIFYVSILLSLMKLSTCVSFDDTFVMWYAGSVQCFDTLHLLCIILVFVLLIFPFALYRFEKRKRSILPPAILRDYKEIYWFYPIFDLFRKGIILVFALIPMNYNSMIVAFICTLLLMIHLYLMPFKYDINNHLESMVLLSATFISILNITSEWVVLTAILSLVPLVPIPYMVFKDSKAMLPFEIIISSHDEWPQDNELKSLRFGNKRVRIIKKTITSDETVLNDENENAENTTTQDNGDIDLQPVPVQTFGIL